MVRKARSGKLVPAQSKTVGSSTFVQTLKKRHQERQERPPLCLQLHTQQKNRSSQVQLGKPSKIKEEILTSCGRVLLYNGCCLSQHAMQIGLLA